VSWVVCGCAGDSKGGHLRVSCRADGCPSVWYQPAHHSGKEVTGRPGRLGGAPGPALLPADAIADVRDVGSFDDVDLLQSGAGELLAVEQPDPGAQKHRDEVQFDLI
jgi:hypothetical protein